MKEEIRVVGLDMATEPGRQGVAAGVIRGGRLEICRVDNGRKLRDILDKHRPVLLAIDSPLGWPIAMREMLCEHRVGEFPIVGRNDAFCRKTDKFVKEELSKIPLEVGANLIARVAHAACALIGGYNIPVLLRQEMPTRLSAIEVYPAATLRSYGWDGGEGGKERKRKEIVRKLELENIVFHGNAKLRAENNDDILDACVCLLAVRDFLKGECYNPKDALAEEAAQIEGWIWVRRLNRVE